jgi:hypothetical protein
MLQKRIRTLILGSVPAVMAALAVLLEPRLTSWAKGRESVLPLIMFLLLSSLLHPRLRHLLVITLCYGVAFLALRDTTRMRQLVLPDKWDYDFLDQGRLAALLLVAALSVTAAVAETIKPGTVWARRCYFGAAGLYFTGLGVINYGWHGSWQSIVLCVTGITALLGCLFAHRIVASEILDAQEEEVNDETLQQEKETQHRRTLRAKEWHDSVGMAGADPAEKPVSNPASPTTAPH